MQHYVMMHVRKYFLLQVKSNGLTIYTNSTKGIEKQSSIIWKMSKDNVWIYNI